MRDRKCVQRSKNENERFKTRQMNEAVVEAWTRNRNRTRMESGSEIMDAPVACRKGR